MGGGRAVTHLEGSDSAVDWMLLYRHRRSKMGDPLRHRRVRLDDGREGTITRASHRQHGTDEGVFIGVTLDEKKWYEWKPGRGYWTNATWTGDLAAVELLDPPALYASVRIRRVMYRGTKEQITQRWADLPPLSDEKRVEGYDRYVEFQPDVAAYRRWRIVSIGPPLEQEKVDGLTSESLRAASERRSREYEEPEPSYGW